MPLLFTQARTPFLSRPPACIDAAGGGNPLAVSEEIGTALLPAPFWCTKRVDRAHFDWRWRERPARALLAWEA